MSAPFTDLALTEMKDGVTIPIRALPHARRTALDGVVDGALRVRLAAPPVEGAANKALLQYLAGVLGIPKRDLEIVSGEHGRHKLVRVRGLSSDEVCQRLATASQ
ncbi:MAG: DUF167 domain-containing protein [Thermomicrobiales bacterium]